MISKVKVKFLGTGTSQGVPVIGCDCEVCKSTDNQDKRLRSSVMISIGETNIVVDAGPDFRYQMLREGVKDIDAILITHCHKDHIAGLDDVRAFNFLRKKDMPIYASIRDQKAIMTEFAYAFGKNLYPGVPRFRLHTIDKADFSINGIKITPLPALHMKMLVRGFRIGDFSYITDTNYIPADSLKKILGSKVIVLNAVRKEPHTSHYNLAQAVEMLEFLKPEMGYITHMSHIMGKHKAVNAELPENIKLAHDGLEMEI